MKQKSIALAAFLAVLMVTASARLSAESRGKPFSEETLLQMSGQVFVGEVLETTTFERYNRTVPTRARVLRSIKGNVTAAVREVTPKDPGGFVYFDKEFSQAKKGQLGLFYVGDRRQPELLMSFKEIAVKKP